MVDGFNLKLLEELKEGAALMFSKDYLGIFGGSMSCRMGLNRFIINVRNASFGKLSDDDLLLLYHTMDYRWKEASLDAFIHSEIYKNFHEARFVLFAVPAFTIAYSLKNDIFAPVDYIGCTAFNALGAPLEVPIHNPSEYGSWLERSNIEIVRFFKERKTNFIIVRGCGVCVYARSIKEAINLVAIIEHSARILMLS